jgi:hypothetical protein
VSDQVESARQRGGQPFIGVVILALVVFLGIAYVSMVGNNPDRRAISKERVSINSNISKIDIEYLVAKMAMPTILTDCGTVDIVTPSTIDPGGWIIDCANGDRYRVRSGETVARFEKHY